MSQIFQPNASATNLSSTNKAINVNNTTGSITLFTITGSIEVQAIWGVVTTVLSANVTVAYLRLNDGSSVPAITVATGSTLSASPVGTLLTKVQGAATALRSNSSAAAAVNEVTANLPTMSPTLFVAKAGGTTNVEFRYTTTDAPSSGAIQWFMRWIPLSADASVTPL